MPRTDYKVHYEEEPGVVLCDSQHAHRGTTSEKKVTCSKCKNILKVRSHEGKGHKRIPF